MRLSRTRMTHKAMHGGLKKARKLAAKFAETLGDLIDDQGETPIDPALLLLALESADQVSRELLDVEVGARAGAIQLELCFEPKRSKPKFTALRECVSAYRLEVRERRSEMATYRDSADDKPQEKPKKSKVDREIEERERLAQNVKDWFRQDLPTEEPKPAEPAPGQGEPKASYVPTAWGESGIITADGTRGKYEFSLWPENAENAESFMVTILCPDGETIDAHVAKGTIPPAEWAAGWIEAHEAEDKPPKRKRAS